MIRSMSLVGKEDLLSFNLFDHAMVISELVPNDPMFYPRYLLS